MSGKNLKEGATAAGEVSGDKIDKRTLLVYGLSPGVSKNDLEELFSSSGPVSHTVLVTEKGGKGSKGFGFVTFAVEEDAESAIRQLQGSCLKGKNIHLTYAKRRTRRKGETGEDVEAGGKPGKRVSPSSLAYDSGTRSKRPSTATPVVVVEQLPLHSVKKLLKGDRAVEKIEEHSGAVVVRFDRYKNARAKIASLHNVAGERGRSNAYFECEARRRERIIIRNLPFNAGESDLSHAFRKFGPIREIHVPPKKDGKPAGFAFVEFFHGADAHNAVATANGTKIGKRVVAVDIAVAKSKYDSLQSTQQQGQEKILRDTEQKKGPSREGVLKQNGNRRTYGDKSGDGGISEMSSEDDEGTEDGDVTKDSDRDTHEDPGEDSDLENSSGDESTEVGNEGRDGEDGPDSDELKPDTTNDEAQHRRDELTRTAFVRNVSFEANVSKLRREFSKYGAVEHCVLVKDPTTGRPRGSAFVRFANVGALEKVLSAAGYDQQTGRQKSLTDGEGQGGIVVDERHLLVVPAVGKDKAKAIQSSDEAGFVGPALKRHKAAGDKRNLWLAHEGRVQPGDPAAQGLSDADLEKRKRAEKEKIKKLANNPNIFVSKTRLSVRNLPLSIDELDLKNVFARAAEVPRNQIVHAKIERDSTRKTASGEPRSKGYGFVSFARHEDALKALRMVNNNPDALTTYIEADVPKKEWQARRLMVEFSLEDARKVRILDKLKEKQVQRLAQQGDKKPARSGSAAPAGVSSGESQPLRSKKRKPQVLAEDGKATEATQTDHPRSIKRKRETSSANAPDDRQKNKSAKGRERKPRRDRPENDPEPSDALEDMVKAYHGKLFSAGGLQAKRKWYSSES
mmetsp:Transcript_12173/g.37111  ORF Transcript_12173/g.37111 Transcript_12173/m.37111 type:complete len:850 (-) Transcript_12173:74-2623(-)|eukprot:CAMPEP_0198729390 /NCGR_PEP_ID=MMETSP1475-20131203/17714_1 /TAXON_ID= ORGANISM="Unidentified sp., Strain CCMP1999" /NCGR_SAMPLE_ID=MMETSP1475 /ASSEMBLY_ACC=CAM_ASM_001111 /LENGTH=849 /DNA_ID=CAMNT_0044492019 /DNA_START=48 /DNA_END=2597 /DNA_ORIENTATION=+